MELDDWEVRFGIFQLLSTRGLPCLLFSSRAQNPFPALEPHRPYFMILRDYANNARPCEMCQPHKTNEGRGKRSMSFSVYRRLFLALINDFCFFWPFSLGYFSFGCFVRSFISHELFLALRTPIFNWQQSWLAFLSSNLNNAKHLFQFPPYQRVARLRVFFLDLYPFLKVQSIKL